MAEGEILEEEAVTQEEEEEGEIRIPHMTNSPDNNPQFSKETDENLKHSCRNGVSIEASIDLPHK